jgi:serine/threonine-protein kinase
MNKVHDTSSATVSASGRWSLLRATLSLLRRTPRGEWNLALEQNAGTSQSLLEKARNMVDAENHIGSFLEKPAATGLFSADPTLQAGDLFAGRYHVEAFLGAGSMGEVYLVEDRISDGAHVALKLLRPGVLPGSEGIERFQSELRIGRSIRHHNVCSLYHLDAVTLANGSRTNYLVMEYLEGSTLDQILNSTAFSEAAVAPILAQILDGLDACHASGIVHGDLKCANILMISAGPTAPPRVVITDFGLSRQSADTNDQSTLMGTPAYMPPEQIRCKPLTAAADIHALGVILYRLLSGGFPFNGATALEVMENRLSSETPPDLLPKSLPAQWKRAILDCLASDPGRRPSTAELRSRLDLNGFRLTRRRWTLAAAASVLSVAGLWTWRSIAAARKMLPPSLQSHISLGEDFLSRRSRNDFVNARLEFQKVIEARPDHAGAWIGLAEAYAGESNWGMTDPLIGLPKARAAAQKAIELDSSNARAYAALGYAASTDVRQWLVAMPHFQKALELDPDNPQVIFLYASHLSRLGRFDEAITSLKKVQMLSPQSLSVNQNLAIANYCAGKNGDFLATARELVRIQPTLANAHLTLAKALLANGNPELAQQASNEAERLSVDEPQLLQTRALIAIALQRREYALGCDARLHELWKRRPIEAIVVASVPAALEDAERAVDDLEAGLSKGDSSVLSSHSHPLFANIRQHRRFVAFCSKIGYKASL